MGMVVGFWDEDVCGISVLSWRAGHLDSLHHARTGIRCLEIDESVADEEGAEQSARRWAVIGNTIGGVSERLESIVNSSKAREAVRKYNNMFQGRKAILSKGVCRYGALAWLDSWVSD